MLPLYIRVPFTQPLVLCGLQCLSRRQMLVSQFVGDRLVYHPTRMYIEAVGQVRILD